MFRLLLRVTWFRSQTHLQRCNMSTDKPTKKEVIQLNVDYLKSRTLEGVYKSFHKRIDLEEIEKQWKAANKK